MLVFTIIDVTMRALREFSIVRLVVAFIRTVSIAARERIRQITVSHLSGGGWTHIFLHKIPYLRTKMIGIIVKSARGVSRVIP